MANQNWKLAFKFYKPTFKDHPTSPKKIHVAIRIEIEPWCVEISLGKLATNIRNEKSAMANYKLNIHESCGSKEDVPHLHQQTKPLWLVESIGL